MASKWDILGSLCEICEDTIDTLWAIFIALCVLAGIIMCFTIGIGHLNDSAEYGEFIDKSVVTECNLIGYNATLCDLNISDFDGSNMTLIGYEFVYESYALDLCGNEILWSHPDELEVLQTKIVFFWRPQGI